MTQITPNDPNHPKWLNMAISLEYGRIWPYMAVYGRIWPYMAVYGRIWPYMAIFDPYLGHFGPFCLMSLLERVIFDPPPGEVPWEGPRGPNMAIFGSHFGSLLSRFGHFPP